jgi:hypothetical protein
LQRLRVNNVERTTFWGIHKFVAQTEVVGNHPMVAARIGSQTQFGTNISSVAMRTSQNVVVLQM